MGRVSSAPQDAARAQSAGASSIAMLRPDQIKRTKGNALARPGPKPPDEQKAIEGLARDLRIAQSVPVIVGAPGEDGLYPLIAGERRLEAAEFNGVLDGAPFLLECIVRPPDRDYLFDSVRENLKRRGLTALQFAHLCRELRDAKGWAGTAEVAKYLGVSRAQVSQHDKLLVRPEGMSKKAYGDLLALVQAGRTGSDTAFYTLTKVEPSKAAEVLDRAQELAEADEAKKPRGKDPDGTAARPARQESQPEASERVSALSKADLVEIPCAQNVFDALYASYSADLIPQGKIRKPVVLDADTAPYICVSGGDGNCEVYEVYPPVEFDDTATTYKVRVEYGDESRADPKGFYHGVKVEYGNKDYVLCGPPVIYALEAKPPVLKPKAKVEKKHVRQAAEESRAIKERVQRTIPELRSLFDKLRSPGYPDPMRSFISLIAETWWRGEADDQSVVARWTQIAMLVESGLKHSGRRNPEDVHTPRERMKNRTERMKKAARRK